MLDLLFLDACKCSFFFCFSSRRRHTICYRDWSSDVCSSDLDGVRQESLDGSPGITKDAGAPVRTGAPDGSATGRPPGWCAAERCGHGPEETGRHPARWLLGVVPRPSAFLSHPVATVRTHERSDREQYS